MKKVSFFLFVFFLLASIQQNHINTYVFICTSPNAYAYHAKDNCRGIAKCKYDINKVLLQEAQKKYKPCGICY